jgi:hypothetical protein
MDLHPWMTISLQLPSSASFARYSLRFNDDYDSSGYVDPAPAGKAGVVAGLRWAIEERRASLRPALAAATN